MELLANTEQENPMAHDVVMPQIGESIAESTVSKWLNYWAAGKTKAAEVAAHQVLKLAGPRPPA
jgi:hypothetical protein